MTAADWMGEAACRGTDPRTWDADDPASIRACLAICGRCPVRGECLADAMAVEGSASAANRGGIRGGFTPEQRYSMWRGRPPRPVRLPAPCPDDGRVHGTRGGYDRGCRGESCLAAGHARDARRWAAKKQAVAA